MRKYGPLQEIQLHFYDLAFHIQCCGRMVNFPTGAIYTNNIVHQD